MPRMPPMAKTLWARRVGRAQGKNSMYQDHCFYVMEFVDGETVEAHVSRRGPLPPAEALRLALQVARALAAAAKKQLVHRDLKPANLMLVDQEGEPVVKVIDFGLAKGVAGQSDESSRPTVGGGFIGTPYYASPEQVEGSEVDTRSDLYSLGATLHFLLTGRPPFSGSAGQVMSQHLYKPVPMGALAGLPGCVAELVQRLTEKDPRQRPQTVRAVQEALLECLEQVCGPATAVELAASAPKGPLEPGGALGAALPVARRAGRQPAGPAVPGRGPSAAAPGEPAGFKPGVCVRRPAAGGAQRRGGAGAGGPAPAAARGLWVRNGPGGQRARGRARGGAIPTGGAAVPRGLERAGSGPVGKPLGAAGRPCPGPPAGARGTHSAGHSFDRPGLKWERDPIGPFTAAADGMAGAGAEG